MNSWIQVYMEITPFLREKGGFDLIYVIWESLSVFLKNLGKKENKEGSELPHAQWTILIPKDKTITYNTFK